MAGRFKVPHTLVLLFSMILLAWVATLVLPAGSFETTTNDHGREVVVPALSSLSTLVTLILRSTVGWRPPVLLERCRRGRLL